MTTTIEGTLLWLDEDDGPVNVRVTIKVVE